MGRGGAPAREISFVSLMAYGPKVSDSALAVGVTASETRQGVSQQNSIILYTLYIYNALVDIIKLLCLKFHTCIHMRLSVGFMYLIINVKEFAIDARKSGSARIGRKLRDSTQNFQI